MLDDRKLFSSISVAGTLKSSSTMLVSSGSEDEFPSLSPRLLSVASNVWVSSAQRCLNPSSVSTFGGFAFDCLFGFPTGNILRFRAHPLQGDSLRHCAKTSVLKYLNSIYRIVNAHMHMCHDLQMEVTENFGKFLSFPMLVPQIKLGSQAW